jgi:hypothetical protein
MNNFLSLDIPLAPIVAIDGFNNSVLVGYALVAKQDKESFMWIFNRLIEQLPPGGKIHSIITDQDAAMRAALEVVMPNTKHLLCK